MTNQTSVLLVYFAEAILRTKTESHEAEALIKTQTTLLAGFHLWRAPGWTEDLTSR